MSCLNWFQVQFHPQKINHVVYHICYGLKLICQHEGCDFLSRCIMVSYQWNKDADIANWNGESYSSVSLTGIICILITRMCEIRSCFLTQYAFFNQGNAPLKVLKSLFLINKPLAVLIKMPLYALRDSLKKRKAHLNVVHFT